MPSTNTSTTTSAPSVKKYVDYAAEQVDEQAILDRYNAATIAQYNVQREQNRQAENDFYNQMYNTQRTAMDTIRQANAAAVSTGASRGVQAANELSALLGLQSESVASATELAQANRQTAQEETAAVLENVLNAYQQASQERSQLVSQAIESASVDAQESANQIAAMEAETNRLQVDQTMRDALQSAATESTAAYLGELANQGYDYSGEYTEAGRTSLDQALASLTTAENNVQMTANDWSSLWDYATGPAGSGAALKYGQLQNNIQAICKTYGLDYNSYKPYFDKLNPSNRTHAETKDKVTARYNANFNALITQIKADYLNKASAE